MYTTNLIWFSYNHSKGRSVGRQVSSMVGRRHVLFVEQHFFSVGSPAYRGSKPAKWSSWKVSQKPRFSTENLQTLVFVFPFYPSWRYRHNGMTHATAPGQQKVWWTVGFLAALSAEGQHERIASKIGRMSQNIFNLYYFYSEYFYINIPQTWDVHHF